MKQYKVNKGFITQKLKNKTVIFDGEESVLYTFNESASYIFQYLKKGYDGHKIVQLLAKRYCLDEKKALTDLDDLLKDLLKKKIITQKTE